jgi:hypothetical protein
MPEGSLAEEEGPVLLLAGNLNFSVNINTGQ